MKAAYYKEFGSTDVLQIGELPKPKPAADAHRMSESRQTRGKIVLKVQDI